MRLYTTAGRLLDGVTDHGNGCYTQLLAPSYKVETSVITATVNGVTLNSHPHVYFTSLAPGKIFAVCGNNQTGRPGTTLAKPLRVRVVSDYGLPVYGAPVTFTVIEGGGSISAPQPIITNRLGLASIALTMGPNPGKTRVSALLNGVKGSPVIFTATGEEDQIKVAWLYDIEGMKRERQKDILFQLEKSGVNRIYLSLDGPDNFLLDTPSGVQRAAEFVYLSANSGIKVEGMILKDPNWIDLSLPWSGQLRADEVIRRVNKVIYSNILFDGIHIDVQPHKHPDWTSFNWKLNNELMLKFQTLVSLIKDTLTRSKSDLSLSATVAWWYNDAAKRGLLPEGDTALLSYSVDYIVPVRGLLKDGHIFYDGDGRQLKFSSTRQSKFTTRRAEKN